MCFIIHSTILVSCGLWFSPPLNGSVLSPGYSQQVYKALCHRVAGVVSALVRPVCCFGLCMSPVTTQPLVVCCLVVVLALNAVYVWALDAVRSLDSCPLGSECHTHREREKAKGERRDRIYALSVMIVRESIPHISARATRRSQRDDRIACRDDG